MNARTVLFSHRMLSHAKKWPPATHIIPEASVTTTLANLEADGAVINHKIEYDVD